MIESSNNLPLITNKSISHYMQLIPVTNLLLLGERKTGQLLLYHGQCHTHHDATWSQNLSKVGLAQCMKICR